MAAASSVASISETIGKYTRFAFLWLIKIITTLKTFFIYHLFLLVAGEAKLCSWTQTPTRLLISLRKEGFFLQRQSA